MVKVKEPVCTVCQITREKEHVIPPLKLIQPQLSLLTPSPQGPVSLLDPAAATSHLYTKEQYPHLSCVWCLLHR